MNTKQVEWILLQQNVYLRFPILVIFISSGGNYHIRKLLLPKLADDAAFNLLL